MTFSLRDLTRPAISLINTIASGGALGIDIGTSAIKIVQLNKSGGSVVLDSYGSADLARYRDPAAAPGAPLPPETLANAIMDLIHGVAITSRVAGVSLSGSATMIVTVEMPSRDEDQIKKLMYAETQKYIPGSMEDISLDWFVLPDESAQRSVFDKLKAGATMIAKPQTVLFAAMPKAIIKTYDGAMKAANISSLFYEIEAFSGARAVPRESSDPILMIDIGASSCELYVVERNMVRAMHAAATAGSHFTTALAAAMGWEQKQAEEVKSAHGLTPSPTSSAPENDNIRQALTTELDRIIAEAQRVIATYHDQRNVAVAQVVLLGGSARMPGIAEYASEQLHVPVEVARPFSRIKGPAILESTLKDIGPIYANAIGLALRALG